MPPPSHQTFEGRNFVICSFCPRKLDFDPDAMPIPYHHSNLNSEEMIYYVDGNFSSRKGIDVGSVTLHPSGHPARAAAGARREVDRDDRDARAGGHVRHVPPAAADDARARARRRHVRVLVVRRPVARTAPRRTRIRPASPRISELPIPEPYDFVLSTERFRAFGRDPANLWHEGGLHRVVGGREVRIEGLGGREPLDAETEPVVLHLLGAPFDAGAVLRLRRGRPGARPARCAAARLPAAARARPVRGARLLDLRAAGLAPVGLRDPRAVHRGLRRAGRPRVVVPDPRARRRGERGRPLRARLLAPQGGVRARPRALRPRSRRPRVAARRRGARGDRRAARARPVDGGVVPGAPPRAADRVARRRPRAAQGGRALLP